MTYDGPMTSTTHLPCDAHPTLAARLLAHLADRDFERFADAFEPDFAAIAVLPAGVYEWRDRAAVRSVFEHWFGAARELDVVGFAFNRIGPRMHLRWRIALSGGHVGDRRHVVEQQLYADLGATARISSMAFLCSGFHPEDHGG